MNGFLINTSPFLGEESSFFLEHFGGRVGAKHIQRIEEEATASCLGVHGFLVWDSARQEHLEAIIFEEGPVRLAAGKVCMWPRLG